MSNVTPRIRVNVLAYNEEDFIELCLESINEAVSSHGCLEAEVNIICNGCRDNTYHVAERYCENRNGWHVFDVEFGDKANAWNFAIEEGNRDPILTVFVDGDCTITPDSIRSLLNSYLEQPNCYIIAGLPKTKGRTTDATRSKTIEGEALSGNFYALTPSFLKKVYQLNFRLPVGLIGDDSLLAWVASHDFKLSTGFTNGYMRGCEGMEFYYHRLTPNSVKNIVQYVRRLHRYSLRHLQQSAIRVHLEHYDRFDSLPDDIQNIYGHVKMDHLRLKSTQSAFDMINYFKMKTPRQQYIKSRV